MYKIESERRRRGGRKGREERDIEARDGGNAQSEYSSPSSLLPHKSYRKSDARRLSSFLSVYCLSVSLSVGHHPAVMLARKESGSFSAAH